jgi:hypothetical protein
MRNHYSMANPGANHLFSVGVYILYQSLLNDSSYKGFASHCKTPGAIYNRPTCIKIKLCVHFGLGQTDICMEVTGYWLLARLKTIHCVNELKSCGNEKKSCGNRRQFCEIKSCGNKIKMLRDRKKLMLRKPRCA